MVDCTVNYIIPTRVSKSREIQDLLLVYYIIFIFLGYLYNIIILFHERKKNVTS